MSRILIISLGIVTLAWSFPAEGGQSTPDGVPTFAEDVAPILFDHCVSCHRPGEVAPMSLTSYEDARPWARAIKGKVVAREMPPWFADPRFGAFRNDRTLTQDEIDTISQWADAGAPKGEDAALPELPTFADGWQGGEEPDYVFVMPEFDLPAEGEIPYSNFYVKNTLEEDRFLAAAEMRPGDPAVVHHARIDVVGIPEGCSVDDQGLLQGPQGDACPSTAVGIGDPGERLHVLAYVPGRSYERYAPGTGKRLAAGLWLKFGMHYQLSGQATKDASRFGVWFSKVPVTHEVFTRAIGDPLPPRPAQSVYTRYVVDGKEHGNPLRPPKDDPAGPLPNIPPHTADFRIAAVTPVTEAITLYNMWPHMHLRGKDMKWIVTWPDGREETILSVPNYDFNWQLQYELEEPLRLPAGSKLTAIGHYDNSFSNRYNPAPDREVYWAEQSWDEMFSPYIEYVIDRLDISESGSTQ